MFIELNLEETVQTKLLASVILFIITLLCGYLPVKMLLNQTYVRFAMFAGGGVLMATAFCHLIPEAHDNYKAFLSGSSDGHHHHTQLEPSNGSPVHPTALPTILNSNISNRKFFNSTVPNALSNSTTKVPTTTSSPFIKTNENHTDHDEKRSDDDHHDETVHIDYVPYPEITLCFGFFFMYIAEYLMTKFINRRASKLNKQVLASSNDTNIISITAANSESASVAASDDRSQTITNDIVHHAADKLSSSITELPATTTSSCQQLQEFDGSSKQHRMSTTIVPSKKIGHLFKFLRGFLIISAFGAHSIFDGVAIGSQNTNAKVMTIFIAICCHKLIIAAVVGLELFQATFESHLWTLIHLSIFSAMSPIGIILVVIAQNSFHIDESHPLMVLLQSFATGTLLYIVFIEILQPKEGDNHKNQLDKTLSLLIGFILMTLALTLIGHG